jgi:hypothetical protein
MITVRVASLVGDEAVAVVVTAHAITVKQMRRAREARGPTTFIEILQFVVAERYDRSRVFSRATQVLMEWS